ncbi:shikimate dehydrogenase [bacterium]|nr:shikimate dehydrogenase [bacterium]
MNRFGFLIHPLGMQDVVRYAPNARGKREALVSKILEWMPPYRASTITGVRSKAVDTPIEGQFITIPMLPQQFLEKDRQWVFDRVLQGALLAQNNGAQIVGLGGYNSVVGEAGKAIAERLEVGVTSGNSYTVASAMQATLAAARAMDLDMSRSNVAVVGATGAIGGVCSRLLARQVARLSLVARSRSRLQTLAERIHKEGPCAVSIDTDLERGVREADVIVSATSSGGGILRSDILKPGVVICDVALPHDISREVARQRPDVLVIEGGVIQVPGEVEFNFDFGYPPGHSLACMAETMILTLEGRFEDYSLGRGLELDKVEEISQLALKHGFRTAGLRAFDEPVTADKIEEVKSRLRDHRRGLSVIR